MNCCAQCFHSPQLQHLIDSTGIETSCDFCKVDNVNGLECESQELRDQFSAVLDLYIPDDSGVHLAERLLQDFPRTLFSSKDPGEVKKLLDAVFINDLEAYRPILENRVILRSEADPEYRDQISALAATWENFCEEIKSVNRFHLRNVLDLDKLGELLTAMKVRLPAGTVFFRGRLSDSNGFPADQMGNPPSKFATAGRANPVGISYLYLAGDPETALFEIRAGLYDYATIGEFRLLEDIYVVDLKDIAGQDPFALAETELLEEYMAFRPFLHRLGEELSTPNRRTDTELDYIPTQYLAEFIKSQKSETVDESQTFDGIGYGSSLNATGHNYAMFDATKFECVSAHIHEINHIQLSHKVID